MFDDLGSGYSLLNEDDSHFYQINSKINKRITYNYADFLYNLLFSDLFDIDSLLYILYSKERRSKTLFAAFYEK